MRSFTYRVAFSLLTVILFSLTVHAQDGTCSLKLAQLPAAPELMGFRVGMSKDEVTARVPHVVFGKTDDFGVSKTSINPDFDPRINKSSFAGVRTVSLDFLDGKLTSLWLGYDSSFRWPTVSEFVKGISESMHLPDAWISWKTRGQMMRCADFQMTVSVIAEGPSFRILDEVAEQTIAARREAKEEKDSQVKETPALEIVADRKTKVYYPHGCTPDKGIKDSDRLVFITKEEAEKAGYKPARNCLDSHE